MSGEVALAPNLDGSACRQDAYSTLFAMLGQMTCGDDEMEEEVVDEEEEKLLNNFISFADGESENNFQLFTPSLKISPRTLQAHLK